MIAHIFEDRCTGCNTCVTTCPTHVLDMRADGPPQVARLDQCQTCYMCELYCDADAIYVAPDQHEAEAVSPDAILASGHLGRLRHDYGWDREALPGEGHLRDFWRLGPLLREGADIAARRYATRQSAATQHPAATTQEP